MEVQKKPGIVGFSLSYLGPTTELPAGPSRVTLRLQNLKCTGPVIAYRWSVQYQPGPTMFTVIDELSATNTSLRMCVRTDAWIVSPGTIVPEAMVKARFAGFIQGFRFEEIMSNKNL
jgi:hypothetical protein